MEWKYSQGSWESSSRATEGEADAGYQEWFKKINIMITMIMIIMMTMMYRKTEKVESKKEGVEDDGGLGSMAAAVGNHHHSIS